MTDTTTAHIPLEPGDVQGANVPVLLKTGTTVWVPLTLTFGEGAEELPDDVFNRIDRPQGASRWGVFAFWETKFGEGRFGLLGTEEEIVAVGAQARDPASKPKVEGIMFRVCVSAMEESMTADELTQRAEAVWDAAQEQGLLITSRPYESEDEVILRAEKDALIARLVEANDQITQLRQTKALLEERIATLKLG